MRTSAGAGVNHIRDLSPWDEIRVVERKIAGEVILNVSYPICHLWHISHLTTENDLLVKEHLDAFPSFGTIHIAVIARPA